MILPGNTLEEYDYLLTELREIPQEGSVLGTHELDKFMHAWPDIVTFFEVFFPFV